ncbi:MAG TPA: hypothetical protein VNO86_09685 [Candidatus Binatia bacterium]|nr:hypothetical protein [Candidatus Binatia bacterium]
MGVVGRSTYDRGMDTARVGDFRPSRHGLHFANRFPPGPTLRLGPLDPRLLGIGDASQGLCGGMCFVVGDLWAAGVLPPDDRQPPAFGSPRFRRLVHRQVESLDWLRAPLAFWLRAVAPDAASSRGSRSLWAAAWRRLGWSSLLERTMDADWPPIRATIDAGHLAMVGLVRGRSVDPWSLVTNHLVVAYAYRMTDRELRLAVYDPNHPDRDDVELVVEFERPGRPSRIFQTTGEPLHGFFGCRYRPEPPGPWRPRRPAGPQRDIGQASSGSS